MRNYLILREKVCAFRADPEVIAALAAARVDQLSVPTLADGETWRDVVEFTPDTDVLGRRGMAFEHLDQRRAPLAVDASALVAAYLAVRWSRRR